MECLKKLEERVNTLEEQRFKKPEVLVKCIHIDSDMESGSSDEHVTYELQTLPHIEARVFDRDVLIRIHCLNYKGVLVKALEEVEKLNLNVVNSSALPFGTSTLDITLIAQMDADFTMAVKDLEEKLRSSLTEVHERQSS